MSELELHMGKAMIGDPIIKITKKMKLASGDFKEVDHYCECNPDGVSADIQMKHVRHAITEIQKLLLEKEGSGDILKRNNKKSKWRVESYHHMSFKQLRVQLNGSGSEMSSLPSGKESEIIDDN